MDAVSSCPLFTASFGFLLRLLTHNMAMGARQAEDIDVAAAKRRFSEHREKLPKSVSSNWRLGVFTMALILSAWWNNALMRYLPIALVLSVDLLRVLKYMMMANVLANNVAKAEGQDPVAGLLSGTFEAIKETAFNNIELVVGALTGNLSLVLVYTVYHRLGLEIMQMVYKVQDFDDFTTLLLLGGSTAFCNIWPWIHLSNPGWTTALIIAAALGRWADIIYVQRKLMGSELAPVYIYMSQGATTADSAHLYVWIPKEGFLGDLRKIPSGPSGIKGVVQEKEGEKEREEKKRTERYGWNYYIPFLNYGAVGVTTKKWKELESIHTHLLDAGGKYSATYKSCQEFAFRFAEEICEDGLSMKMSSTNLKALVVIGLPLIIWALCAFKPPELRDWAKA